MPLIGCKSPGVIYFELNLKLYRGFGNLTVWGCDSGVVTSTVVEPPRAIGNHVSPSGGAVASPSTEAGKSPLLSGNGLDSLREICSQLRQ